jgi:hypothetical protein
MKKIAFVIPLRLSELREPPFRYLENWLKTEFVDIPIYIRDSVGERFNVSEARNRGCLDAINDGVDILIVLDADTLPRKSVIEKAVRIAEETGALVMSKGYVILTEDESVDILKGEECPTSFEAKVFQSTQGGLWVMGAEVFKTINGWDERFIGWGYEDTALLVAYKKIYGKRARRIKSLLLSLWHGNKDFTVESYLVNQERYLGYKSIDKKSIHSLVDGNMAHLARKTETLD